MFRKITVLLLTAIADSVFAGSYRFLFDPDDLINLYTSGQSADYAPAQSQPRFVYDGSFTHTAATYTDHPSRGSRWAGNADYYADWLAGLGAGEGIRSFNIWITTAGYLGAYGNPYSRIDLQQNVFCGADTPSIWLDASASGDWTARRVMVYSNAEWGASYGIQWYTTNSASYLRPGGTDLGVFSFTITNIWTGSDPENPEELVDGEQYRLFFGSTAPIFDDQGWGSASGLAPFTNRPGYHQWQGDMPVTVQEVIPEPTALALAGLAGALLFIHRRWLWRAS